jgi:hypothetical protein
VKNRDAEQMMRYYWETTSRVVPSDAILGALSESGFSKVWSTTRFGFLRDYHAVK